MNAALTVSRKRISHETWISFGACVIFGAEQTTYNPNRRIFPTSTFS